MCYPRCRSCGVMESSTILFCLRVITILRDIIYVIIILYSSHLVILELLAVCVEQLIQGHAYDEYLVFGIKIGYDRSGNRAVSTVETLA
jgi:hypothetical protein